MFFLRLSRKMAKDTCWVRERELVFPRKTVKVFGGLRDRHVFVKDGCFGMKDYSTALILFSFFFFFVKYVYIYVLIGLTHI